MIRAGDAEYLVAGAGYTGERLLAALPAGRALGLSRRPPAGRHDLVAADLDDEAPALPEAATVIYTVPPPAEGEDDPRLARFLAALPGPPRRFVYFSTTGVYGDTGGERVDEDSPPQPGTARARRRLAAETRLADWCAGRDVRLAVLRVPGIYGPGRLGLERLRAGKTVLRDAEAGPGNRIQVEDLVRVALAAAQPEAPGGRFNVGDGDYRSSTWFAGEVARQAGLPAPRQITLAEARATWSPMRLSFALESRRVDVTRMREVLGVEPVYADAADGIRASLADTNG